MRKRIILLMVAAVAMFALVGGAAIVSADHRSSDRHSGIVDRMAEILGLSPDEVSSAMAQAHTEAKSQRMADRLAEAVEADAISDWFAGKPDALHSIKHRGLRSAVQAGETEAFLADLVTQELITQLEADDIIEWLELRPASTDSFREWRTDQHKEGDHKGRHGRRHGGFGHFRGGESTSQGEVSDPV
jgi:hypothetical protein